MQVPRFRLLGPIEVWGEAGPVELRGAKQRAVLAVLLLNANRVVPEPSLAGLTWGDSPPPGARGQIQLYVSRLRKLIGDRTIDFRASGYRIEVRPGDLDLHRFDDEVAAARTDLAAGRTAAAIDRLRAALAWWQGDPLGGAGDVLTDRLRPLLVERRLAALEDLFAAELSLGRGAPIIGDLRRAAEEEPVRETLQAQLMRALHAGGRTEEALRVYTTVRERLATELGVDPGRALQEAHLHVLTSTPPATTGPATAVVPRQLPSDLGAFAGRTAELAALDGLLPPEGTEPRATSIATITGGAGVGKTTLAVHWAHRIRHRFPDGQLHADLRGSEPDSAPVAEVVRCFLDALPVPGHRIPAGLDAQIGLYRSLLAERRMLILLDNVRSVAQVRPLLPGAPGSLVVITGRDQLTGLAETEGARVVPLGTLSPEDAEEFLVRRIGAGRVAAEQDAAQEILTRCARLPLALSAVAARAATNPGFTLAMMAGELRRNRGGLESFEGARTAFARSYRALSAGAARLFRLLGAQLGPGIGAAAAADLAGESEPRTRRLLTELAAAHLITEPVPGRFVTHGLLQAYARELAGEFEPATA